MKIAICAGHGLNTPGKRTPDNSLHEWEFNSAVVTKLINKLKTCQGVEILRTDDPTGKTDVPLKTRTDKANAWKADVYYSQHANAAYNSWNSAGGLETYTYTTKPKEAVAFAAEVQKSVVKATGLKDRGVKAADLHIVRETHMTAILQEGPFMSNKDEAELLKSDAFREKYAEAVFQAFVSFFKLKVPKQEAPKEQPKSDDKLHRVQVGAFSDKNNAQKLVDELKKKGYNPFIV
ncbi:N-acetylmuramoyl-L-alanine amidase [Bacillus sp. FJAT-49736]|uniref:N-acetylmuramoyl-L-alanine amidase n=1 Tax=Bacillus sp. FJAT-49736 TaxID=2833582 RepID=UPI002016416E|nr:N-acetylmuramoyl-L-alanine amidase [Bacillus sp. FJAT-49736]